MESRSEAKLEGDQTSTYIHARFQGNTTDVMNTIKIGRFVVSEEAKHILVEEKLETWVAGVKRMVGFVRAFPQMAYADLTMSIHNKWQFVQHVTYEVRPLFAPPEEKISDKFFPYRLGGSKEEVTDSLCKRNAWDVNWVGIGIPYPTQCQ